LEQGDKKVRPVVAVFDFDGTITYTDTTFFFLLFSSGLVKAAYYFLKALPVMLSYLAKKTTRQQTKESIFKIFFNNWPLKKLTVIGEQFAKERIPKYVRKEALRRIRWHQMQNHRCVLVSASINVYLEPWAQAMGFEKALTSRLAVDERGRVTGKLMGLNCRNQEKVRRLKEFLGSLSHYEIYAYGDSDGDRELLEVADFAFYQSMPKTE